ncbi:MAG TPA: hypothetical protein VE082_04020, partial [Desulfobaccales bacterium]|nr:hypothetical protein [Desulfobaccales bacterium]
MSAQILELPLPPGSQEEIAAEYKLSPDLTPEAAASQLPPAVRQSLSPLTPAFEALHRGLSEDLDLTGISTVRLYFGSVSAARLEPGPAPDAPTAGVALAALAAGPQWSSLLAGLLRAQALYPGVNDTRLPRRFAPLARIVAPLRHLLAKIRVQAHRQPQFAA